MAAGVHLDPERWAAQKRAMNRALHRAEKRLKKLHPEDWERIYTEEAAKQGITPRWSAQRYAGGTDGRARDHA